MDGQTMTTQAAIRALSRMLEQAGMGTARRMGLETDCGRVLRMARPSALEEKRCRQAEALLRAAWKLEHCATFRDVQAKVGASAVNVVRRFKEGRVRSFNCRVRKPVEAVAHYVTYETMPGSDQRYGFGGAIRCF